MRRKIQIFVIFIFFSGILYGQQICLVSGNLDFLNGQTKLMTKYDYEGMSVGEYDNELHYVDEMVKKLNEDKPGKGDKWREGWFRNKTKRFHPSFELALNKRVKKKGVIFGSIFEDAKYTLIIKFIRIEPGYSFAFASAVSNISVYMIFIETNNPENEMARILIPICTGSTAGYMADRIENTYVKCGNELGKYLVEKTFTK